MKLFEIVASLSSSPPPDPARKLWWPTKSNLVFFYTFLVLNNQEPAGQWLVYFKMKAVHMNLKCVQTRSLEKCVIGFLLYRKLNTLFFCMYIILLMYL